MFRFLFSVLLLISIGYAFDMSYGLYQKYNGTNDYETLYFSVGYMLFAFTEIIIGSVIQIDYFKSSSP